MSYGRIINGVKYIFLMNENIFKKKSLCDNVYFTLRDIFANADSSDTIMEANYFNALLTNSIYFENRSNSFEYTNKIYEPYYVKKLLLWLKYFNIYYFEFCELDEDEEFIENKYIKFDEWWIQFQELIYLINKHYNEHCARKEEFYECRKNKPIDFDDECYTY